MGRMTTVLGVLAALVAAAPGQPSAALPPSIFFTERTAEARPARTGCTYVGGGTFDVQRRGPDTFVVTMLGAVVATGHPSGSLAALDFDLTQTFEISGGASDGKVRLSVETQLIGLLRGGRIAAAAVSGGATIVSGGNVVLAADLPDRSVACGENLTVNDRVAPDDVAIVPGQYQLYAHWRLAATHPAGLRGKAASAEFAPESALDPIWVGGPRDPFHGAVKKNFGFRVMLRVTAEPAAAGDRR